MTRTPVSTTALAALLLCACGRTGDPVLSASADTAIDAAADTAESPDTGAADVAVDPAGDTGETLRPAPLVPGPERSEALDELYCRLDNGQLIQAALRAAACLDQPAVALLEDTTRGLVFGSMLEAGYFKGSYGDCEYLACLNNAVDCAEAEACRSARVGEPCSASDTTRCDGDDLELCQYDGLQFVWLKVQSCERLGGVCEVGCVGEGCQPAAGCSFEAEPAECGYYGSCEGDTMVRCAGRAFVPGSGAVRIPCNELVEGGTCAEFSVGGEAPGPACVAADRDCEPGFGDGFDCTSRTTMTACLFGRRVDVDCAEYGYSACRADEFNTARCEP
jgi:hypothetical protein